MMRLADLSAGLIVATSLAASAFAQNTPQTQEPQTQEEVFVEGMSACAVMFSERHPAAKPPPFPPSSSPFIDNGYGKERAAAYGFKPLPVEDLMKAGWNVERLGQQQRMELYKRSGWGMARLSPSDLGCGFSMFSVRDALLDGDLLLAAASSWIAKTYPEASVVGEAETPDERFEALRQGRPSGVARTLWTAPEGMRLSLSITRPHEERGAFIVSIHMNYLPRLRQPALPPAPVPPT